MVRCIYDNVHLLKCHKNISQDVLKIVSDLSSTDNVKWCEPEMNYQNLKTSNELFNYQYYLKRCHLRLVQIAPYKV